MAEIGEPGVDGVTVELFRDGEGTPLASTVTADDGSYVFEGILCGNYRVEIPGGQGAWSIDGETVDPATLAPASVSNPDANDDDDNDNNGLTAGDAIVSGTVQIGDCGQDGDFSNDASNEPTNEVDRKTGPDDDSNDDAFEDVRSNVSVDIGLILDPATVEVCDADGNVVAGGEDGVDGNTTANCGDDDPTVPVEVGGAVECPAGSDRAGETVEPGESCDTDDDDIPVEVAGQVEEPGDAEPGALAVTGLTSQAYLLAGLIVLVLGAWFAVAAAWFRPQNQY